MLQNLTLYGLGELKQEKWMAMYQGKLKNLRAGVCGGFDYYA